MIDSDTKQKWAESGKRVSLLSLLQNLGVILGRLWPFGHAKRTTCLFWNPSDFSGLFLPEADSSSSAILYVALTALCVFVCPVEFSPGLQSEPCPLRGEIMSERKQYVGPKDFDFFFFLIIKILNVLTTEKPALLNH